MRLTQILISIFLFFSSATLCAQKSDRISLRYSFHECISKERTESFYKKLESTNNKDVIGHGYKGAVLALRAKYSSNPFKKYNYCKEGLDVLSKAIADSPQDLELRYLRLIIQSNIPSFLGMNCNLNEDKNMIISKIDQEKDLQLKKIISHFLLNSDICSDQEKKLLVLS